MASSYTISRTVRICRWQTRVNSLWLWAYCVLTLALHGYLMYRAVSRCKNYNELPWRTHDKPVIELYVYIALIVLSVMCVPFFLITSIFKVGNFAGDGVRLGRDNIHEEELAEAAAMASIPPSSVGTSIISDGTDGDQTESPTDVTSRGIIASKMHALWRHVGPFSHGFHVVSAFSLLLPSILLEAQEIKYGFRNPDTAWRTDLDWMFGGGRYPPANDELPPVDVDKVILQYTSLNNTSANPLGDGTDFLDGDLPSSDVRMQTPDTISPEYINYIIALIFYCVRYAAVFWYTKMSFSIVFIVLLFIVTVHFGFSFCGAAILYKFQMNKDIFTDLNLVMPSEATICMYVLANFFLLLSLLAVFNYGLQHYRERWQKFLQSYAPMYCKRHKRVRGYHSYGPHTMASILLLLVILCRGGIVYDYVKVYRKTGFALILACIVMDAIYMVSWIAFWFALTLKQTWNFRIMFARYVMPSPSKHARTNGVHTQNVTSSGDTATRAVTSPMEGTQSSSSAPTHNKRDGKALNVDVEMTDSVADVHGPAGMLRSSKHRRSNPKQRVQFDASADNDNSKRPLPKDQTSNDAFQEIPGNLRRAYSDSTARGRNRKHNLSRDSSSDEYVTESTPENTLTRTYRHSIRDTCGLYFRISRDMSPAPAAHSSPIPVEKRQTAITHSSPPSEEILLDPLKADNKYSSQTYSAVPSSDTTLSNSYSPGEGSALAVPLSYSPNDSGVHLRHNNVAKDRAPTRADNRYSYPMAAHQDAWSYGEHQNIPRGPPPSYGSRKPPQAVRHSVHLDRPQVHDGSYIAKPSRKSHDMIPWSPDSPARQSDAAPLDRHTTPPPPPRPPRNSQDFIRGYTHPRDIKIVKKPDLAHRDSALPSSNETSSSDSNDVLCSQV